MNRYKKYEPIFGEWTINSLIGEGSFGRVYEIERKDFGRTYKAALKAITIPESESEIKSAMSEGMDEVSVSDYFMSCVEQVVDEFALMSKLKGNSHIVSYENHKVIPHVGKIGWDILIQMELLTPINEYFNKHIVTQKDVIKLGIDLCQALEVCHKYNIIHRDIKPENIFISEIGDYKLGDFGIARTIEKTTSGLSKKGTYGYMAPEVYRGEAYGSSVDLYSLGLVLYRLLNNNRLPFLPPYPQPIKFSDKDSAFVQRMNGVEIPKPSNASDELVAIVLKATSYKAGDRYNSAEEMRKDLENLLIKEEKSHALNTTESVDADIETHEEGTVLLFNSNKSHSLIKNNVARIEYKTELINDNVLPSQGNLEVENKIQQKYQNGGEFALKDDISKNQPMDDSVNNTVEEQKFDEVQIHATAINATAQNKVSTNGKKKEEISNGEVESNQKKLRPEAKENSSKKFYIVCGTILGTLFLLILISLGSRNSIPVVNSEQSIINDEQKTGSNHAEELYYEGKKYFYGDGVEQDYKKALLLFGQSADLGNSNALVAVGVIYYAGLGVEENIQTAMKYWENAADLGNTDGMIRIGRLYLLGYGVERDNDIAFKWFEKAANLGDSEAFVCMGNVYGFAYGNYDKEKAEKYYTQAAEMGNASAYYELGQLNYNEYIWMFNEDANTKMQYAESIVKFYNKGAELGDAQSMKALGDAYKKGDLGLEQNNAKADEWYKKAEEAEKNN